MTNDEGAQARADTHEHEAYLLDRMIGIVDEERIVVQKDGLGFLEGDPMPLPIRLCLGNIPFEAQLSHAYSITTL